MVIDTSALVAILQGEPERRNFIEALDLADSRRMSVATFVEASLVIESRYGAEGLRDLDRFLSRAGVELIAVDRTRDNSPVRRSAASAKDGIGPVLIMAIASLTPPRWR